MAGIRHLSNKKSAKQSTAAKSSARAFTKRVNRLKQAAAKPASSALKRKRSKREGGSEGGQSQGSTQQSDCSSSSNEVAFGTPDLPPDVLFFQLETLYEYALLNVCRGRAINLILLCLYVQAPRRYDMHDQSACKNRWTRDLPSPYLPYNG
jgi:hypothetical protein